MLPRTLKNNFRLSLWLSVVGLAILLLFPLPSYAYNFNPPDPNWQGVCPSLPGFTQRIVVCITSTVLAAANAFLAPFMAYMYGTLAAIITIAIAAWGIMMATGKMRFVVRLGAVLLVKIGVLVMLFTGVAFNFQYLFGALLDAMGELLAVVTNYVDVNPYFSSACQTYAGAPPADPTRLVWYRVDCVLDSLVGGIFTPVSSGIGGFFLACVLSSAAGFFVGSLGFLLIIQVLFAIVRAVYIFIMSYLALAIMAIIAPIFLPLMLLRVTKGYFEKWLKLTLGFIIQPIFLFTYLAMLLAAFDAVVYSGPYSLYNVLVGGDPDSDYHTHPDQFRIGNYLTSKAAYSEKSHGNYAVNIDSYHATKPCPPGTPCSLVLDKIQTGVLDKLPEATTQGCDADNPDPNQNCDWNKNFWKAGGAKNIYEHLGLGTWFFSVDMPSQVVDWEWMACVVNQPAGNSACTDLDVGASITRGYIITAFLSLIMAVAVTYIFMMMLEFLPFIGSGVVGDVLATPTFGSGSLSPPGAGMVNNLRGKLMGGT